MYRWWCFSSRRVLLSRVEKYYKEYVFHASRNTKILKATLGNDAGMYGAARLVLNE